MFEKKVPTTLNLNDSVKSKHKIKMHLLNSWFTIHEYYNQVLLCQKKKKHKYGLSYVIQT